MEIVHLRTIFCNIYNILFLHSYVKIYVVFVFPCRFVYDKCCWDNMEFDTVMLEWENFYTTTQWKVLEA